MEGYNLVKKYLRQSLAGALITGFICLGLLALLIYAGIVDGQFDEFPLAGKIFAWLFMALCLVVGIGVFAMAYGMMAKRNDHPLLQAIRNNDRQHVVWMYVMPMQIQGASTHLLTLKKPDGKAYSLNVRKASEVNKLMAYLPTVFPDAIIGHTKELEMRYKSDPAHFGPL